ncbi:MAG: hypothetical protein JWM06_2084 [Actinomycetia bacterium]|jgi:hypothetical protein|nr:hypothetical protein [Actinomycetes bacterium]
MKTTYAVKWREPSGHTFLGRLEFSEEALVLEGRNGSEGAVVRTIAVQELTGFRLAQSADERLDGQATLVVERPSGDVLVTSSVVHAGVLQELVHRLSQLHQLSADTDVPVALE